MRNLTIERRKRFVASLAKMYVYLEDAEAGTSISMGSGAAK